MTFYEYKNVITCFVFLPAKDAHHALFHLSNKWYIFSALKSLFTPVYYSSESSEES